MGPLLCSLLLLIWWVVGSRARWHERLIGFAGVIAGAVIALVLVDNSMRGPATMIVTIPLGLAAFSNQSVIVHAGGSGDKGILAFDVSSGELCWSSPSGDHSYSSPQLCRVAGEDFIVMITNRGCDLLDPQTGSKRLDYDWSTQGYRTLQPQIVADDSILIATGMGTGTRRVRIIKSGESIATEEVWTSLQLKPDFNDFVVYQGHIYGFDGGIFTCVSLDSGKRKWKGGRYGKGQVLLLEDSGLLLVASEHGDIVLVKADPASREELAQEKGLEGKTWNHPVVVATGFSSAMHKKLPAFDCR